MRKSVQPKSSPIVGDPGMNDRALWVLLIPFVLGAALEYALPPCDLPWRFPADMLLLTSGHSIRSLIFWIGVLLLPGAAVLAFSSSTTGCFVLPILFLVFGSAAAHPMLRFSPGTDGFLWIAADFIPLVCLVPALFLLGETGFQRSFVIYRFSRGYAEDSPPPVDKQRAAAAFGLIWLAALIRWYFVPL